MNKRLRKKKGLSKITHEELWDLDVTLAKYILPRLIRFKEINKMGYPTEFNNSKEWHEAIDKMIWSFNKVLKDNWNYEDIKNESKRYLEGMHLFAEHFSDLWD